MHGDGDLLGHAPDKQIFEQEMSLHGMLVVGSQRMDEGDLGGGVVVESHTAGGTWMTTYRRISFDEEFTAATRRQCGGECVHVHVADVHAIEPVEVCAVTMADADIDSGVVA